MEIDQCIETVHRIKKVRNIAKDHCQLQETSGQ